MNMNRYSEIDEATLNAFVDGQLDAAMHSEVLQAMESNAAVREEICRLRSAKDWMQTGFADARPSPRPPRAYRSRWPGRNGVAATVLIALVALGGGLTGYQLGKVDDSAHVYQQDRNRVLLHLDQSSMAGFDAVLTYAEDYLETHRDDGVQVEVVANAGGIDLMRAAGSGYAERVSELSQRYHNLHFIACANALHNLRRSGDEVRMLDSVEVGTTAIDHIVSRLQQGWTYRRVDSLPDI